MKYFYFISKKTDAYTNLSYDTYLLNNLDGDSVCLLFYVNENAVIIGRNQNPFYECDLEQMKTDEVQLVRRVSGGGAVYHDMGNLNFSFHCPISVYSEDEQTNLIRVALSRFGLHAEKNGRNDLTVAGRKFSGNAYCTKGKNQMRHGTLMVDCDTERMSRYLTVPQVKLETKGVKSVRSRVCNLAALSGNITVDALQNAILEEFCTRYSEASPYLPEDCAAREIQKIKEQMSSYDWLYGESPVFTFQLEERFSFGTTQLQFAVQNGMIADCVVYTDSLDVTIPAKLQARLNGVLFEKNALVSALSEYDEVLSALLTQFDNRRNTNA